MWKQDDKELDKLSREAAENYLLDHQPGSWDKILRRLDAELPEKERKRRWLPFLLLFLIVGGGLAYWGVNKEKPQRAVEVTEPKHESNIESPHLNTKEEIPIVKADFENNDIISAVSAVKHKPSKQNLFFHNKPDKSFEEIMNDQVNSAPSAVKEKVGIIESKENSEVKKEDVVSKKESLKKEEEIISAPSAVKQQKAGKKKSDRWTFGLVYAPDLSSVKFTHTRPLGTNLGLTVDYKLNNRLSLQTGAIYTIKNYKLHGKDFNPPKGYWTYYYKMRDVTGSCNMWEIPLNLRFNAVNKKSSKVFITTGLSSYLMQKENYSFHYYTSSGVPVTRARTYTDNENYMFSILSISAGFEKQLNKKFSLQVEPFFKQPIKGIGFGNIKMNSSGIYLGLRFTPGGK